MEKGRKLVTSAPPHLGAGSTPEPMMLLCAGSLPAPDRPGDRGPGSQLHFFPSLNVCGCFAYMYVWVPCTRLVCVAPRGENQIPWSWSYRCL